MPVLPQAFLTPNPLSKDGEGAGGQTRRSAPTLTGGNNDASVPPQDSPPPGGKSKYGGRPLGFGSDRPPETVAKSPDAVGKIVWRVVTTVPPPSCLLRLSW